MVREREISFISFIFYCIFTLIYVYLIFELDDDDTDDDTPNNDNPMVASFAEDVEIDDYIPGQQDFLVTFSPVFFMIRLKLVNCML